MKQAILILGYRNIHSIIEIIKVFGSRFNFYIHLDRKSHLDLSALYPYKNVFVSDKYKVNWGGSNFLSAILFLAEIALKDRRNIFFHLISGEDYPVKPISEFNDLDMSYNYLEYFELPTKRWAGNDGMDRIDYFNLYDLFNAKKELQLKILKTLVRIQKAMHIKRGDIKFEKVYGGSVFWSLNRDVLQYVVDYSSIHPEFLRRLKYTICAEEIYFHTVILNSHYANTVHNDNLRFIDWESGRGGYPAFLDESDFVKILFSNKIFARKINDSISGKLKDMLNNYLLSYDFASS